MKKILIVYYSRTGMTKKIAESLGGRLGADLEEIISVKNRSGVLGYLLSGKEAARKEAAQIQPAFRNAADYDLVIIGTPVWGWNISSPMRAYLQQNIGKLRKLALFCTMGGSGDKQSFEEMEKICGLKSAAQISFLTKEVQAGAGQEKLDKFIGDMSGV